MSEHRKDRLPTPPDQLPGEAEMSELYQENTQEQPSSVVDQLILNEARKATRPPSHLRLVFQRWTVPVTLAAGLLVSIGVMTTLKVGTLHLSEQKAASDKLEVFIIPDDPRSEAFPTSQSLRPQRGVDQPSSDASLVGRDAGRAPFIGSFASGLATVQKQQATEEAREPETEQMPESLLLGELLGSPEEIPADSLLSDSKPAQRSKPGRALGLVLPLSPSSPQAQIKRKTLERKTASDRRLLPIFQTPYNCHLYEARKAWGSLLPSNATGPALRKDACSSNVWLQEVIELRQAGRQVEAEASFGFFRERYPHFDNFPENFPQELLGKAQAEADSDEH